MQGVSFKTCPRCSLPVSPDVRQCPRCGAVFPEVQEGLRAGPEVFPGSSPGYTPGQAPGSAPGYPQGEYGVPPFQPYGYSPPPNSLTPWMAPGLPQPYLRPGQIARIPGTHSAGLSILLSFLFPGAGQIYNGQTAKGVAYLLGSFILVLCTFGLASVITTPLAMVDAGLVGSRLNRGEVVGSWQWF